MLLYSARKEKHDGRRHVMRREVVVSLNLRDDGGMCFEGERTDEENMLM